MAWLSANWAMVVLILFGISEVLAQIPSIKSNSVFQLLMGVLDSLAKSIKVPPAPPAP